MTLPSVRTVPFAVTEEALKLLHLTYADFAKLPLPTTRGRVRAAPNAVLGPYDFEQVRAQSAYLRIVSIVEAFTDSTCADLFAVKTRGLENFVALLAEAALDKATATWEERKNAMLRYHNVSLGTCTRFSDVMAAVAARNAIAHGLGGLTRRQRSRKDRDKIMSVGIALRDRHLNIDTAALDRCVQFCSAFVHDVDTKIPRT
jgi:hypothetical protein